MKTFSSVAFALLTMVGMASAQPAPAPKAPAPKADAKTPAPKADPKAGAPAPADPKAAKTDAPPTPAAPPAPPAEIAAAIKAMGGNWKCTGQGMGMDMKMTPMTGAMKMKADLDGWWMQDTVEAKMGKTKLKMTGYSTYDAASKKWRRVVVDNMGGQMIGTSDGMKDNKITYNLDTMGGGGPAGMFRDHTEMVDAKNAKGWGEMSMDKGKTWTKVYEMTCKK